MKIILTKSEAVSELTRFYGKERQTNFTSVEIEAEERYPNEHQALEEVVRLYRTFGKYQKIRAIKTIRALTNWSLLDSKNFVEEYWRE